MVAGDFVVSGQPLDAGPELAPSPAAAGGWRAARARAGRSLPSIGWGPRGLAIAAAGAGLLIGGVLLLRSPRPAPPPSPKTQLDGPASVAPIPASPAPGNPASGIPAPGSPAPGAPAAVAPSPRPDLPLRAAEPSEAEIQALLQAWLAAKAAVLAGGEPPQPLANLARPPLLRRLQAERQRDLAAGTTQEITAKVVELQVAERQAGRIVARVRLSYGDRHLDASGKGLTAVNQMRLTNSYVFGRDEDGIWRLVGFRPTN